MVKHCEFAWRAALKYRHWKFKLITSEFHFVKAGVQSHEKLVMIQSCLSWLREHRNKASHSHIDLATNPLPVTHHWCRIEPSSAVRLIIFWDRVTSYSNPVIFGKQRAKVSWMSGVSRGGPRGSGFICITPDGLWMCLYVPSTPHASSLSDLSILLRDILICKENKHHQKDGEYKESVIIKVGGAGTSDFPHAQMHSKAHRKAGCHGEDSTTQAHQAFQ